MRIISPISAFFSLNLINSELVFQEVINGRSLTPSSLPCTLGYSVALSQSTLVVSAPSFTCTNSFYVSYQPSISIYTTIGNNFTEWKYNQTFIGLSYTSLAVYGNAFLAFGTTSQVLIYTYSRTPTIYPYHGWSQQQKLTIVNMPSHGSIGYISPASMQFVTSSLFVVGVYQSYESSCVYDQTSGIYAGMYSVYIFKSISQTLFSQQQILYIPACTSTYLAYGNANGMIAVVAMDTSHYGYFYSVYIFSTSNGAIWTQSQTLSFPQENFIYTYAAALDTETLAVSTSRNNSYAPQFIYIFNQLQSSSVWTQTQTLVLPTTTNSYSAPIIDDNILYISTGSYYTGDISSTTTVLVFNYSYSSFLGQRSWTLQQTLIVEGGTSGYGIAGNSLGLIVGTPYSYSSASNYMGQVLAFSQSNIASNVAQPTLYPTRSPTPKICPAGTISSLSGLSCDPCPPGTTSSSSSSECLPCGPGTYTDMPGSPSCLNCAVGEYSPFTNATSCEACPAGKSSGAGSTAKSDCFNPTPNFVIASVTLAIVFVVCLQYLLWGRFHLVAFIRFERIISKVQLRYKTIILAIGAYVDQVKLVNEANQAMESVADKQKKNRWWKLLLFLIAAIVAFLVGTAVFFIANITTIFFSALIIWRGFRLKISIDVNIKSYISAISSCIHELSKFVSFLHYIFDPIVYVYTKLSEININFSQVGVTCAGAQAPLQLLLDCLILGFVAIVIESEVLLLWRTTLGQLKSSVQDLLMVKNARPVLGWSTYSFVKTGLLFVLLTLVSFSNPLNNTLKYVMGFTVIEQFVANNGLHPTTQSCDYLGDLDSILGVLTTLLAFFSLPAAVYAVARVLVQNSFTATASTSTESSSDERRRGRLTDLLAADKPTRLRKLYSIALKISSVFAIDLYVVYMLKLWELSLLKDLPSFAHMSEAAAASIAGVTHIESADTQRMPMKEKLLTRDNNMKSSVAGSDSDATAATAAHKETDAGLAQLQAQPLTVLFAFNDDLSPTELTRWAERQRRMNLISYYALGVHTQEELIGKPTPITVGNTSTWCGLCCTSIAFILYFSLRLAGTILCYTILGHLCTEVGRAAWFSVLRKYVSFVVVSTGIWTEGTLNAFAAEKHFMDSSVFPVAAGSATGVCTGVGSRTSSTRSSDPADTLRKSHSSASTVEGSGGCVTAEQSEIRKGFCNCLAGLIEPRALLYLLFPGLSPLAVFSILLSDRPFVFPQKYAHQYMLDWIVCDALSRAVDRAPCSSKDAAKSHEHSRSHTKSHTLRRDMEAAQDGTKERGEVEGREEDRTYTWRVYVSAGFIFVEESRLIQILFRLFQFSLSFFILFVSPIYWVYGSLALLLPFCIANTFPIILYIGGVLDIADDDLFLTMCR